MTIDVKIKDGSGNGRVAKVTRENSILVTDSKIPPEDFKSVIRPFRQYVTDTGISSGSRDMRVNGSSSTPIDFYISAPSDADRYIDTISIAIADAGAALNEFGNIGALSNGVEIFYEDSELGDVIIGDELTSNFEFLRLCAGGVHGIGNGASSYRANNVQGSAEGFLMYLDFSEIFNIPWGIRLRKGTKLRLVIRIKDDTRSVDKFDMIAYGFDRIIEDK